MAQDSIGIMTFKEIKKIWRELHNKPELRKNLRTEVLDSWERSYQKKIPHMLKEYTHFCSPSDFKAVLENSSYLIHCSLPVMESLLEFVAGTGFVVGLTDPNLVVLKVIGDKESLKWSKKAQLIEGSIWTEDGIGTNAGSLALSLVRPMSVYGYEHYSLFAIVSAASFCPILDNGRVVGGIGMVAPYDRVSNHTLGMVVAAAKHIQSTMALERVSQYQQVVMNSMSEGIMVVNNNGNITFMNKKCATMLDLQHSTVVGTNIYDLFGNTSENSYFMNIVSKAQTVTDEFIILTRGKLKIRCNITCTPLHSLDSFEKGSVIIIRESERINSIVGKWIGRSAKMTFDNVIGNNQQFREVINIARAASSSNSNVLLLGESGTGKDIIAQAMHNESPRKNNPFIAINCAALPRELIASELFGYEDGAFTGAKKGGNTGKFELADQGTIFLDEIGDVPLDLQATLLRVIEEKSVTRLGGSKLVPVNVRIIAATNKKLEEEIAKNRFRRDLYYRLGVIRLSIPPLRERPDDILLLARYFLEVICKRFNKPLKRLSSDTIKAFLSYYWPGNVRELQNVLESAVQLATDEEITFNLVKDYFQRENLDAPVIENKNNTILSLSDVEKQMIENYIKNTKLSKDEIANVLGISRRTLYRRLEKYNLL